MAGHDSLQVVIGVDVGGTNTDAVILSKVKGQGHRVLAEHKHLTTADVTTGVRNAVLNVLRFAKAAHGEIIVTQVNIGTTHFVNAVVQHKHLSRVAVVRLCGPTSRAVPPFADFPPSLTDVIRGATYFVNGGHRVDGREIEKIDPDQIRQVVGKIKEEGLKGVVVCGIFAPTRIEHEEEVKKLIHEYYPEASVTLSHTIGHIGLLERENAAILNESLKELCQKTVSGFRRALTEIGIQCPIYLTQNDGTVISEEQALTSPVFTFASGPTNSMRGAAFLCDVSDAIVVDIGGTSTDVGVLKNRFPREASTDVRVGGVRTNFRMPDVHSVGLGGGSYVVKNAKGHIAVGPMSAGFNLLNEALVFGGSENGDSEQSGRRMTATDIAVAAGLMELGNKDLVKDIPADDVTAALRCMETIVQDAIDSVRVSGEPLPVILVGGGSKLLDRSHKMQGVTELLLPEHYGVANAIGAALSQVSGNIDSVVVLERMIDTAAMEEAAEQAKLNLGPEATQVQIDEAVKKVRKPFLEDARNKAMQNMCQKAREAAIASGADPTTVEIVEQEDVALSYLPGSATRIKIKAVGDLADLQSTTLLQPWTEPEDVALSCQCRISTSNPESELTKQTTSVTGLSLISDVDADAGATWAGLKPSPPHIDPATGEWILSEWDVECIAVGAGILGAGGGGNPHVGRVRAREALRQGQKIRIISPDRLLQQVDLERDLLVSVAFMGAPVVLYEQTTSGQETPVALRCLQDLYSVGGYIDGKLGNTQSVEIKEKNGVVYIDDYQPVQIVDKFEGPDTTPGIGGSKVVAILCAEVGGMNSLEPLMVSAILGLPVVDADGMGRAFPMLQMFLPFINGIKPYPSALADDKGRRAVILSSPSARQVEDHFRNVSMQMGSAAGLAIAPVKVSDMMENTVLRSFTRVWRIGDSILQARRRKENPLTALISLEPATKVLLVGKICDITRETSGAFNRGRVHVEGNVVADQRSGNEADHELQRIVMDFQNENLVVRRLDSSGASVEVLAVVPDIISIVDAATAEPIPTEEVRYGQRVAVIVLAAPPPMVTSRALQEVGPAAFGYPEVQYIPVGQFTESAPIPPS